VVKKPIYPDLRRIERPEVRMIPWFGGYHVSSILVADHLFDHLVGVLLKIVHVKEHGGEKPSQSFGAAQKIRIHHTDRVSVVVFINAGREDHQRAKRGQNSFKMYSLHIFVFSMIKLI